MSPLIRLYRAQAAPGLDAIELGHDRAAHLEEAQGTVLAVDDLTLLVDADRVRQLAAPFFRRVECIVELMLFVARDDVVLGRRVLRREEILHGWFLVGILRGDRHHLERTDA